MSLARDNMWKLLVPLAAIGVMFLIPVLDDMPSQAQRYFAVFAATIVGVILGPVLAVAISFIAVTTCVIGSNYLLFDAKELVDSASSVQKQALKWGSVGFSSTTVWLVFGAFIFALGYEVSGLGRRIVPFLVKFMGKRILMLGYAIVIIDVLLVPLTPSNTACTGGTVLPAIKNLLPPFKSSPNDPSVRRIGGYLMWMMIISTSLSSSMFITGAAPSMLGLEFVSKIASVQISWLQWFLCLLSVGVILLIITPWLFCVLYKPEITHGEEVATWVGDELKIMDALTRKEWMLTGLVLFSSSLWVFGSEVINVTAVGLLAVSLMLVLCVVPWKDITCYNSAWSTLVNLATLAAMANGLTCSGFISWFANTMSMHLEGSPPNVAAIVLVLAFYLTHYLLASLSAHTAITLSVILAVGKGIPGVPMEQLCILLMLSIGIMGCLTPYTTDPGVTTYGCGYAKSKDHWHLGVISGVIYISMLLLVGWPILAMWS